MFNFAAAQEGKPMKPPTDENVQEQTEDPGSEITASLTTRFERIKGEKRRLEQLAIDSGKLSKRYQTLSSQFDEIAQNAEAKINESETNNNITAAVEAEIHSILLEMEAQLKLIELEIAATEPGKPPENGKPKRSK